jgi:hypothetical protein
MQGPSRLTPSVNCQIVSKVLAFTSAGFTPRSSRSRGTPKSWSRYGLASRGSTPSRVRAAAIFVWMASGVSVSEIPQICRAMSATGK